MATKIAITNEKGGCGKTTTAVNVAAILAEQGQRVLLVDADYQSYATAYYGLYQPEKKSLYHVLFESAQVAEGTSQTSFGVDILRSSAMLKQAEDRLGAMYMAHERYAELMQSNLSPTESQYDVIVIDCPPQSYRLLEVIQSYADYLIVPMIPDEFALHSLRIKAENLLQARRTLNPRLQIMGGLIVMQENNATKRVYTEALLSQSVVPFFHTAIRKNITLSRAINAHQPINVYAKSSNGNQDYQALMEEIMGRIAK